MIIVLDRYRLETIVEELVEIVDVGSFDMVNRIVEHLATARFARARGDGHVVDHLYFDRPPHRLFLIPLGAHLPAVIFFLLLS